MSYGVPDPGTGRAAEDAIAELESAFRERDRTPRAVFIEELSPELPAVLESRGWRVTERIPVLTCSPDELRRPPWPSGLRVEEARPEHAHEYLTVQRIAFLDDEPITEEELERWRRRDGSGAVRVLGIRDDVMVGTAIAVPPADGVVELVGVGTLPEHRRQGIAGVLTAEATRLAFDRGAELAWLSAADDTAARIYERAGFARVATQVGFNLS